MELIYLFSNLTRIESVESYSHELKYHKKGYIIKPDVQQIENSCFVATFSLESESLETAKDFAAINKDFSDRYCCQCLSNGASAKFNIMLYPLVNEFERMLREYIYLKQQLIITNLEGQRRKEKDKQAKEIIKQKINKIGDLFKKKPLEEMDFTEIYSKLFVDPMFCDKVKQRFFSDKDPSLHRIPKEEYLKFISEQEEHIIWSDLTGGKLEIIKQNYKILRDIRNDVMHAHNINYDEYHKSEKLFKSVNKELKAEISQLITLPVYTQNIDLIFKAFQYLAKAVDDSLPDFNRQFAKTWVKESDLLDGVVDEVIMNKALNRQSIEGDGDN